MKASIVIVTFNNATMLLELLDNVHSQTLKPYKVIVIDNASQDETESLISPKYPEIEYVRLDENTGSAGGFYEGISRAYYYSYFIYLLDDDVQLARDALEAIVVGFLELEQTCPGKLGAVRSVSPNHPWDHPTPFEIFSWRGSLLKAEIVREVGLPRADYFLYGEDLEYSLRFTRKGYRFFWIPRSICQQKRQTRDGKEWINILGKSGYRYRDPFRHYYAFRNEVSIYREYRMIWNLLKVMLYAGKLIPYIIMKDGRAGRSQIYAIIDGLRDGFLGRLGKNPQYLPKNQ